MSFRTARSKLYQLNALSPKEELEEKLEKCHAVLVKLTTNLSDREVQDILNQTVCKGPKDHEEISLGLFYAILTEPPMCQKAFVDLSLISRDSFSLILGKLTTIITDKLPRLLENAKRQMLWLIGELIANSVAGAENVCVLLLKQIQGGDTSPSNLWLAENVLLLLKSHKDWLESNAMVLSVVVYTYLRLIEDHDAPRLRSLRQLECDFCISLLRSNFSDCIQIGRDFIRVLQNCTRIPEFTALWKDILYRPQSLSSEFTGISQVLAIRTSRRYLACRLTVDMESKLGFLTSKVRFGQQKRYQDWFYRQYLSTPENHTLIPDLVRYLCGVIHPSNEVLCSDIIPRWAIFGWLATVCQSPVSQANTRLAGFYDWLSFSPERDSIMNIEPAMLLMHNSVKTHPTITWGLLDFVIRMIPSYYKPLEAFVSQGVKNSFRNLLEKRVVSTIHPLFNVVRTDRELRTLLKTYFSEFLGPDSPDISSDEPTSPKLESPDSLVPGSNRKDYDMSEINNHIDLPDHDTDEAVFSDDDDDAHDNGKKTKQDKSALVSKSDNDFAKRQSPDADDITEMDEFQLIDNSLLRDNLCKLKAEQSISARLEAMDSILSTVEAIDLHSETASALYACLAICLSDDLLLPLLPKERTAKSLEMSLEQPQFALFRLMALFSADGGNADCYFSLFNGIHEANNKIGYHYLYFLKTSNNGDFSPYTDAVSLTKEKTLKTFIVEDMRVCHTYDVELFSYLVTSVFKTYPKECVGNKELLRMLASSTCPAELHSIVSEIVLGDLVIIGENQVESLLEESLSWDSFEQYCLWQLLIAEETPVEMVIGVLPNLKADTHSEALCNLLLQLRHETPVADVVKPVLCMDSDDCKPGCRFSTCLFKYWCQDAARDLANVVAQLLTKQASAATKRRQARNSSLRHQPSLTQILHHLKGFQQACVKMGDKSIFKYDVLKTALEHARATLVSDKLRITFEPLFTYCNEASERPRPTRKRGRRDSARGGQMTDESEEESENDNDDQDDEDDQEDADDQSDDVAPESSRLLRSGRSPSRKRRRSSLNESDDD